MDLRQILEEALVETAEQLQDEIVDAEVIPKDQGTLENSHHVIHPEERRAGIAASTPYARRLYMHPEYNFRKGENRNVKGNRNAKGKWFEDWEPGGKYETRVAEIFADKLEEKLGGS